MTHFAVKDELLDAQTLRAAGVAPYGGADIGECLTTATAVSGKDLTSWHAAWTLTAGTVLALAESEQAAGRLESAQLAFFRASSYFRTAGVMLNFSNGAAALARGYNVLTFDGPGQGAALLQQGLVLRPDWEAVITPVVEYLLTRADVDPARIALIGLSLGGYLAPRAASAEHRLAACIADCGSYDLFDAAIQRIPRPLAGGTTREQPVTSAVLRRGRSLRSRSQNPLPRAIIRVAGQPAAPNAPGAGDSADGVTRVHRQGSAGDEATLPSTRPVICPLLLLPIQNAGGSNADGNSGCGQRAVTLLRGPWGARTSLAPQKVQRHRAEWPVDDLRV